MSRCKKGEKWSSTVNHQSDGSFTIVDIDGQGNFTGKHGQHQIQGQCKGGLIWYVRKTGGGDLYYSGRYLPGDEDIQGVRSRLPRLSKRKQITDDDDWVGTHTT